MIKPVVAPTSSPSPSPCCAHFHIKGKKQDLRSCSSLPPLHHDEPVHIDTDLEGSATDTVQQDSGRAMAVLQATHAESYAAEAAIAFTESSVPGFVDRFHADVLFS